MPSPELLAWRKARKNLKAFHKANPKLKGKYLSLRRSVGRCRKDWARTISYRGSDQEGPQPSGFAYVYAQESCLGFCPGAKAYP